MTEHALETVVTVADPDEPEAIVAAEAMRVRRPLAENEEVVREEVLVAEQLAEVEGPDGDYLGTRLTRRHLASRTVRRKPPGNQ